MNEIKELNGQNWERYNHYRYYKDKIKSGYTMSAKLDANSLLKAKKYKTSDLIYFCVCKALNKEENINFRIFEQNDKVFAYDNVNILFTIFHKNNKTFSNVWAKSNNNLEEFVSSVEQVKEENKDIYGVSIMKNKPKNCVPVSIIPWIHFESFCSDLFEETANCFPIITIGKIENDLMPVSIYVKHSVADGYHTAKLLNDIQEEINSLEGIIK